VTRRQRQPGKSLQHIAFLSFGRPVHLPAPGGLGFSGISAATLIAGSVAAHNRTVAHARSDAFD